MRAAELDHPGRWPVRRVTRGPGSPQHRSCGCRSVRVFGKVRPRDLRRLRSPPGSNKCAVSCDAGGAWREACGASEVAGRPCPSGCGSAPPPPWRAPLGTAGSARLRTGVHDDRVSCWSGASPLADTAGRAGWSTRHSCGPASGRWSRSGSTRRCSLRRRTRLLARGGSRPSCFSAG
jgi:hypothetical protein